MLYTGKGAMLTTGAVAQMGGLVKVIKEYSETLQQAEYLLFEHGPDSCPEWREGYGDCGKPECMFCRISRCIVRLDEINHRFGKQIAAWERGSEDAGEE